jgi:hypothetical protein
MRAAKTSLEITAGFSFPVICSDPFEDIFEPGQSGREEEEEVVFPLFWIRAPGSLVALIAECDFPGKGP